MTEKQSPEWEKEFDDIFQYDKELKYMDESEGYVYRIDENILKSYIKSNFVPRSEVERLIEQAMPPKSSGFENRNRTISVDKLTNLLKGE